MIIPLATFVECLEEQVSKDASVRPAMEALRDGYMAICEAMSDSDRIKMYRSMHADAKYMRDDEILAIIRANQNKHLSDTQRYIKNDARDNRQFGYHASSPRPAYRAAMPSIAQQVYNEQPLGKKAEYLVNLRRKIKDNYERHEYNMQMKGIPAKLFKDFAREGIEMKNDARMQYWRDHGQVGEVPTEVIFTDVFPEYAPNADLNALKMGSSANKAASAGNTQYTQSVSPKPVPHATCLLALGTPVKILDGELAGQGGILVDKSGDECTVELVTGGKSTVQASAIIPSTMQALENLYSNRAVSDYASKHRGKTDGYKSELKYPVGHEVVISDGNYSGFHGIVAGGDAEKLSVRIELFGKSKIVDFPSSLIEDDADSTFSCGDIIKTADGETGSVIRPMGKKNLVRIRKDGGDAYTEKVLPSDVLTKTGTTHKTREFRANANSRDVRVTEPNSPFKGFDGKIVGDEDRSYDVEMSVFGQPHVASIPKSGVSDIPDKPLPKPAYTSMAPAGAPEVTVGKNNRIFAGMTGKVIKDNGNSYTLEFNVFGRPYSADIPKADIV